MAGKEPDSAEFRYQNAESRRENYGLRLTPEGRRTLQNVPWLRFLLRQVARGMRHSNDEHAVGFHMVCDTVVVEQEFTDAGAVGFRDNPSHLSEGR